MKNQVLFSSKNKSKKKSLLQVLFGALWINTVSTTLVGDQ